MNKKQRIETPRCPHCGGAVITETIVLPEYGAVRESRCFMCGRVITDTPRMPKTKQHYTQPSRYER